MAAEKYKEIQRQYQLLGGKKPLKRLCEEHQVGYWSFMRWRRRNGYAVPQKSHRPAGFLKVDAVGEDDHPITPGEGKIRSVRLTFCNGLSFERREMDVEGLVDFLNRIKPLLCSD